MGLPISGSENGNPKLNRSPSTLQQLRDPGIEYSIDKYIS
jgi:hypothetical protein